MRFLLDANVGTRIAKALREAGHDVVRIAEADPTADDPDVLAQSVRTERILVTYDRDFGELVFARSGPLPPAVIYIRAAPEDVARTAARLLSLLDFEQLRDHMTAIEPSRIRRSPFPAGSNDND